MSLNTPSDEVQARMQALRIQNEENRARHIEQARLAEQRKLEKEKEEAEKDRLTLIEAEAEMRIHIEGLDCSIKEEIKNKLKMNIHATTICADAFDRNKAIQRAMADIAKGIVYYTLPYYIDSTDSIHTNTRKGLVRKKQQEIYLEYILKVNDEYLAEKKAEDDKNHQKALEILRADIAKANKALPKYKLNGGVFEEGLRKIEFISNKDIDKDWGGFSFEKIHLYTYRHFTESQPGSMIIPTSWKDDYTEGKLPFLIHCPVCSKQNKIAFKLIAQDGNGTQYFSKYIKEVTCIERHHYMWDPQTNKHHKWALFPDRRFANINECHNSGFYKEWDPKDPDGEKAKSLRRNAKIKSIEAQILELHAEIARLKDGGDV